MSKPELPWAEYPVWREITCGEGWWPIIAALDEDLRAIDPDYRVVQVKEKFGSLRYYVASSTPAMNERIEMATRQSEVTCEVCGQPGRLRDDHFWMRTLCDDDAEAQTRQRATRLAGEEDES